jgi:hypothetical protein
MAGQLMILRPLILLATVIVLAPAATAEGTLLQSSQPPQAASSPKNPPDAGAPAAQPPTIARGTSISGRITVDGQTVPDVPIFVLSTGAATNNSLIGFNMRSSVSDESGRFSFDNLKPGLYRLAPYWIGFIPASGVLDEDGKPVYYYTGDSAAIRMVKGGVITGKIVDSAGLPMVELPVRPTRLRDEQGRPAVSLGGVNFGRNSSVYKTDDRGVYRLYGLEPGVYVVSAGGGGNSFDQGPYAADAPTYYPASVRPSATEVTVAQGQEVGGIDITYQEFKGHSITGSVAGVMPSGSLLDAAIVMLAQAGTGARQGEAISLAINGARNFAMSGVPDGEYNIIAIAGIGAKELALAPPRLLTVNGGDLSGVNLTLGPIPQVAGRVVLDPLPPTVDLKKQCKSPRPVQACLVTAHSNAAEDKLLPELQFSGLSFNIEAPPDPAGNFRVQLVGGPGRYHLQPRLPDEEWFVKSIVFPPEVAGRAPLDASDGFSAAAGQKISDVLITLGEGAGGVAGNVSLTAGQAELPKRLGVLLVPAELGAEGEVLRYAQATVRPDGTFAVPNVTPGQYHVMARSIPDEEWASQNSRPAWWDIQTRKKLVREAERVGALVEIKPCQRMNDYVVRYTPPANPPANLPAGPAAPAPPSGQLPKPPGR